MDVTTGDREATSLIRRPGPGFARATRRDTGPGPVVGAATYRAEAIAAFIGAVRIRSVVELGCGDFRVGRMIARTGVRYTGVDRSDSIIGRNRELYESRKVRFLVGDPIGDRLPEGELCLVGDLFGHLTNAEIRLMLLKLRQYRYVIFDDHQPPRGTFIPNLDKPPGKATRLDRHSALDLLKPPFNVRYVAFFLGLPSENPIHDPNERLCSFLIPSDFQTDHLDPVYLE